jgi:hypothetical protein
MRGVEARSTTHEYVNELKKHYAKVSQQSLQDLVLYRHVLVFFIVACNILAVMYKDPHLFLQVGCCGDDEHENWPLLLKYVLPFCDCRFHIISQINNFQACFVLNFFRIYECLDLSIFPIGLFGFSCSDFYTIEVYNFLLPFVLMNYI